MKKASHINQLSVSSGFVNKTFFLVNLVLLGFTVFVHYLLATVSGNYGNNLLENTGLWLLFIVKIGGANLILAQIFSEFNLKK